MSADLSFVWPAAFLLLPLPALVMLLARPLPPPLRLRWPSLAPYQDLQRPLARPFPALVWLIWLLLVCAAARPQLPDQQAPRLVSGRSLMLAIDLSASMATQDLAYRGKTIDRLAAAREFARGFLARRSGDRIGLIVFGRQAYVHVPPTLDLQAVDAAIDSLAVGLAGQETALGDAIALATKQLSALPNPARVLVLLTDGAHTAGTLVPQRAAWLAQRAGMRIHAVGLGARAAGGNPAFDLDEPTLQAIAQQTGGSYRHATDARALEAFFHSLDALEPLATPDGAHRPALDLAPWLLLMALVAIAWQLWRIWHVTRHATQDAAWIGSIDAALRPHVCIARDATRNGAPLWLLAWLLAGLALAAHLLQTEQATYRPVALRIVVADLSANDHMASLRARLADLLQKLPPGETALALYAGDAYLAVPPTVDINNILLLVPELSADIMPLPGRRPDLAVAQIDALLKRNAADARSVLWLTAAPESLEKLPRPANAAWQVIDIRPAAATSPSAPSQPNFATRSAWRFENPPGDWIPGSLMLLLLCVVAAGFRRPGLPALFLLPAIFLATLDAAPAHAQAGDAAGQAVQLYRAGRYADALQIWQNRDDPQSRYNRGNALAQLGRFAEAEAAYEAVLARDPDNADALFNRDLMRRLRRPPPPTAPPAQGTPPPPASGQAAAAAARLADQWLRGVPDNPAGLLRAKLRLEHLRRLQQAEGGPQ